MRRNSVRVNGRFVEYLRFFIGNIAVFVLNLVFDGAKQRKLVVVREHKDIAFAADSAAFLHKPVVNLVQNGLLFFQFAFFIGSS